MNLLFYYKYNFFTRFLFTVIDIQLYLISLSLGTSLVLSQSLHVYQSPITQAFFPTTNTASPTNSGVFFYMFTSELRNRQSYPLCQIFILYNWYRLDIKAIVFVSLRQHWIKSRRSRLINNFKELILINYSMHLLWQTVFGPKHKL